jgi:hypothetical protein
VVLLRPVHVLVHELGHAGAILALTSAAPTVRLGRGRSLGSARLGRLALRLGSRGLARADCGYDPDEATRRGRIAIAGAGPFLSLGAVAGCAVLALLESPSWLRAILFGSALAHTRIFVTSAWPGGGEPRSDGAQIRQLLRRPIA